jgi:electron transport complex protein RnfE
MANPIKIIKNGIINENPTFVQVIGMCPTLAVTSSAINGIGMGLSTTAVLIFANLFISLLRKVIPDTVRIPCFIVVIATFVTIIEFLLKAYLPALNASLGLYIPLIVVNCLILARAEAFASKNGPVASAFDGIGMGLGFTIALGCLGLVREFIGSGTLFDVTVLPEAFPRTLLFVMAPGGFFTLAILMAILNHFRTKKHKKEGKINESDFVSIGWHFRKQLRYVPVLRYLPLPRCFQEGRYSSRHGHGCNLRNGSGSSSSMVGIQPDSGASEHYIPV